MKKILYPSLVIISGAILIALYFEFKHLSILMSKGFTGDELDGTRLVVYGEMESKVLMFTILCCFAGYLCSKLSRGGGNQTAFVVCVTSVLSSSLLFFFYSEVSFLRIVTTFSVLILLSVFLGVGLYGVSERLRSHPRVFNVAKYAVMLLAMVCTLFLLNNLIQYGVQYYEWKAIDSSMKKGFEEIKSQAAVTYPKDPESIAIHNVAIEKTKGFIENVEGEEDKLKWAAILFYKYYYVNTINRVEYCNSLGIDISPFRSEFIMAHHQEIEMVSSKGAYQSAKIILNLTKAQSNELIKIEINDLAETSDQTPESICDLFRENGKELASEMHVSKALPYIYKLIKDGV